MEGTTVGSQPARMFGNLHAGRPWAREYGLVRWQFRPTRSFSQARPGPQVRIEKRVVNRVNLNQAPPLAEVPLGGEQRHKQQQERPGVPVGNFGQHFFLEHWWLTGEVCQQDGQLFRGK